MAMLGAVNFYRKLLTQLAQTKAKKKKGE